jgi:hypothetical protein
MKKKATKIEILWSECRAIKTPHTFEGDNCWRKARAFLYSAAITSDPGPGYDKTGFKITWEDGAEYEGKAAIKNPSHHKDHDTDLAMHVFKFNIFDAGLALDEKYKSEWAWLTQKKYDEIMETIPMESRQNYIDFLNNYDVDDLNGEWMRLEPQLKP